VTIVNASKIPAEFHAFTKQKVSIFKPMIKHGVLKPEEKLEVEVICNADDASKFNDILHFVVRDGNDKDVVLKARGTGSTIYCVENLEYLNFETVYTYKTIVKEIFIQNKGRKSQKISWQKRKPEKKKNKDEEEKTEEEQVFIIEPESETIPPKYGRNFKFIAHSTKKGKISEQFQLISQIGTERKPNILKTMTIEGEFIQPNLIFSDKKLTFKYKW
jgi:hydrocephalus-inducing protein